MENVWLYVGLGAVVLMIVGFVVGKIVKIVKLPKEEQKKILMPYLIGLVTMAEEKIGAGCGAEKLAEVENYFNKNAGVVYKFVLKVFGKENLKGLIEEALALIKKNFGK